MRATFAASSAGSLEASNGKMGMVGVLVCVAVSVGMVVGVDVLGSVGVVVAVGVLDSVGVPVSLGVGVDVAGEVGVSLDGGVGLAVALASVVGVSVAASEDGVRVLDDVEVATDDGVAVGLSATGVGVATTTISLPPPQAEAKKSTPITAQGYHPSDTIPPSVRMCPPPTDNAFGAV